MAISNCTSQTDDLGRELTAHGDPAFPIGCYYDDLTVTPVPWHWHEELEAAVVTEGCSRLWIENQHFTLYAGDGFFINSGYLHACDALGPGSCRFHSMSFHARLIGGEETSVFWKKYLSPVLGDPDLKYRIFRTGNAKDAPMLQHIEHAWQACNKEETGYEFTVRADLSALLLDIFAAHTGDSSPKEVAKTLRQNARIKQMMQFMEAHCQEPLTVEQIAGSAGISKSECLRVFHQTICMTPIRYLNFLRIQKAAHLLTMTDRKIIDIGLECGFQDMSYFSRLFKQEKGTTPGEYRVFSRKKNKISY